MKINALAQQAGVFDYLVIGGGIIGLTTARELHLRNPGATIALIEKETDVAQHASGRNSGVLHAGFYYSADSLKARFCREGNLLMRQYCAERSLKLNTCGKLVVASSAEEVKGLEELKRRADVNGVALVWVNADEMGRIEPSAQSFGGRALFSPNTASVDPREVCRTLKDELAAAGVQILLNTSYFKYRNGRVLTSRGTFAAGYVVNCAGLYADRVARDFGFAENLVILPFKGLYLKYTGHEMKLKTHIYPVPNLANPFLGVHYTLTVDGTVKIGPTAIPALWRENYRGWSRFKVSEFVSILWEEAKLFVRNSFGFRSLAIEECKKFNKTYFKNLAAKMVDHMDRAGFDTWSVPGIRAQLLDRRTSRLVQDFLVQGDGTSMHVLNAVSPGFTCSFAIARYVADEVQKAKNSLDGQGLR